MSLLRRFRRWWGQDRIRLSAEDLAAGDPIAQDLAAEVPAPIRLRVGDRLEILGRLFRLTQSSGDAEFGAQDDAGASFVVRVSASSIDLIRADGTVHTLDRRDVLIYWAADKG